MESSAGAGSPFSFKFSAKKNAKHTTPKTLTDLKKIIRKSENMLPQELPYTLPELYKGPREWYVHYDYFNSTTCKFERFKESWGLNKKKNLPIREKIAQEIITVIKTALENGFNPFEGLKAEEKSETDTAKLQSTSALTRLQKIVSDWDKTESDSANTTYRIMLNRFRKYLNRKSLSYIQIEEVTLDIAEGFRDYLMGEMKNAPKTVNTSISHLGLFWDELKKRKFTNDNPFRSIKYVTEKDYKGIDIDLDSEDHDFIPLTTEEFNKVLEYLSKYRRHHLRFYGMIYWEFMRPVEITRLKVKDVDLSSGLIRVAKPNAKNKNAAFIQILGPMRTLLLEMELQNYPPDYYLFSGAKLLPGTKQKDSQEATRSWNKIVRNRLKIDKKPYALKHTGNIHYIVNNKGKVDREWMQRQNRHKTRSQTDKYIERLNIYTIDEMQYTFTQLPNNLKTNKKAG